MIMGYVALAVLMTPPTHIVIASREGLIGKKTASGLIIKRDSVFVALPSRSALGRKVLVTYKGKTIEAVVKDVGPHYTRNPYWRLEGGRPKAERKKKCNHAGIDLSDALWDQLEIPRAVGLVRVAWRFK